MFYQNVRSIRRKFTHIEASLNTFVDVPHIIMLTETWLHEKISNPELSLSKYRVYRNDRFCEDSDNPTVGGGVLIAIDKTFSSSQIVLSSNDEDNLKLEELFVKVTIGRNKFIFIVVYIPPDSDVELYEFH